MCEGLQSHTSNVSLVHKVGRQFRDTYQAVDHLFLKEAEEDELVVAIKTEHTHSVVQSHLVQEVL